MDANSVDPLGTRHRPGRGRSGDTPDGRKQESEHGYRACLGMLSLAKRYGKIRLESACMLALQIGACQYRHVRDILTNNRDQGTPATASEWVSPDHAHVRGPGYSQ